MKDPRINDKGDRGIIAELEIALIRRDNPNRRKPRMVWDFDRGYVRIEENR